MGLPARVKGIISENLVDVFGIVISVFLIFLIGISLFTSQTERGGEAGYASMARQIAVIIDRVAAEAGSARMEYVMIRGLPADVTVGSREVVLSRENARKAGASFSAPTGMEEQVIKNPSSLCVVKSRNDKKIIVQGGTCKCTTNDNRCDASCVVDGICDPACIKNEKDYICLPACAAGGDGICDSDCISQAEDWVWDPDCAKPDGVCDPDSDGLTDGVCDPDCLKNQTDGLCDPECIKNRDRDGNGVEDDRDGICDLDCLSSTNVVAETGIVTRHNVTCNPANAAHRQCLGDSVYICGRYEGTCKGGCGQPSNDQTRGAGCHVPADPNFNQSDVMSCCCFSDGTCKTEIRSVCIVGGGYAFANDSGYCVPDRETRIRMEYAKDGVCDLDCADRRDVCDPDCPDYMEQCSPCAVEGMPADGKPCCSGLIPCASSNICSVTCCGNGACEPRADWLETYHPKNWENPCTCSQDCPGVCPRPAGDDSCSAGPFTSGICYEDLMGAFYGGKIEICSDAVKDFLDRRMWDINEVAATTLRAKPPLGWGFDDTRYCGDACGRLQTTATTIEANEAYNLSDATACCESMVREKGCACLSTVVEETACGIGFCGDHSIALYSIIRRLGTPSKDVWVTYTISGSNCRPHAFVVYRCNTSLDPRLVLDECRGRDGQWLALDATGHFIKPMSEIGCRVMCLWWNENGYYFRQEGRIDADEGWAYNQTATCSPSTWEGGESCQANDGSVMSCQFNDYCKRNNLPCTDFCAAEGVRCRW
jgi:hypothetical protein